jgi:hypothetical protein
MLMDILTFPQWEKKTYRNRTDLNQPHIGTNETESGGCVG